MTEINPGVWRAYTENRMTPEERAEFEEDYRAGLFTIPRQKAPEEIAEEPGILQRAGSAVLNMFTGDDRKTVETQGMKDWAEMPEMNQPSFASFKTALGTMLTGADETAQVIKANAPNVGIRKDEKGNYIFKSAIDGQDYAYKPGFQVSDIPRAAAGMLSFGPAGAAKTIGGAVLKSGATQTGIEASQVGAGGNFDPSEVGVSAATGGAFQTAPRALSMGKDATNMAKKELEARAIQFKSGLGIDDARATAGENILARQILKQPSTKVADRRNTTTRPLGDLTPEQTLALRKAEQGEDVTIPSSGAMGKTPEEKVAVEKAVQEANIRRQTTEEAELGMLSNEAKKALSGKSNDLASMVDVDNEILESAKALGMELQPDQYSKSQAFRSLMQAAKSVPGSIARQRETENYIANARKADKIIADLGGTQDWSELGYDVKQSLLSSQKALDDDAAIFYGEVRNAIPPGTAANTSNIKDLLDTEVVRMGGPNRLTQMQRRVLAGVKENPTYDYLDRLRRDVNAALYKKSGIFKDEGAHELSMMAKALDADQEASLANASEAAVTAWKMGKAAVAQRKGIEDQMAVLFGDKLDKSFVGGLSSAIKGLSIGDETKLVKLVKSIPESMRQNVVATGLATAFGKSAKRNEINFSNFAAWYEGMSKNQRAWAALMSNLPEGAVQNLKNLYNVSKGIQNASRDRISTGAILAAGSKLKGAESLLGRMFEQVKAGAPLEAVAVTAGGIPGLGTAVASAVRGAKSKDDPLDAIDKVLASKEFSELASKPDGKARENAARKLAQSQRFVNYWKKAALGEYSLPAAQRWILTGLQGSPEMDTEE